MSDNLRLEKQICFRLYSANKLVCRHYASILKEIGLTYPQYLVMLVLWQHVKGVSVKALGEELDLDSGTLSPLLKRMESHQLIERIRQSNDERIVVITLTKVGLALKENAECIPGKMYEKTGMSSKKLQTLSHTLDQLIENMSR